MKEWKLKINLGLLKNKKKKKSQGELRQEALTNIANKWKKIIGVKKIDVGQDHPLFCSHEHCVYWKLKKLPGFKAKERKTLEEEEEE